MNLKCRLFSTGGNNSKTYALRRDGNKIMVGVMPGGSAALVNDKTVEFPSVTAAKRAMQNPASICE